MLFWSHELLYRILYMRYYCIWYRFSEELHWCAILSRIAGLFMNGCLILYLSVEGPHWNPSMIYKGPLKPLELQIRCCIMAPLKPLEHPGSMVPRGLRGAWCWGLHELRIQANGEVWELLASQKYFLSE